MNPNEKERIVKEYFAEFNLQMANDVFETDSKKRFKSIFCDNKTIK